ncbi:MAG: DUF1385 domain-containing protein [Oscillospiraceae bacterium]|nr:DUF1385 domain-containing protein [Oscillospiraceae bacterium]
MKEHKTSIGGQALIEGVMMRGPEKCVMAVRNTSGEIITEEVKVGSLKNKKWYQKAPLIRGVFAFIENMINGYKCLMRSTELSGFTDVLEPESRFEKWLDRHFGEKITGIIGVLSLILGLGISLLLFIVLPTGITKLLSLLFPLSGVLKTVIESLIKIMIFVLYLWATSLMSDMKRVYGYHGAEHKTIFCYEKGLELTVENVRKMGRFHPRCGTSFIIISILVSIFVMCFVPTWDMIYRVAIKILLLPLTVGISYEFIKLAGRYDNVFTRIISFPGVMLQHITTKEPDDSMIECAITALNSVRTDNPEDDRW